MNLKLITSIAILSIPCFSFAQSTKQAPAQQAPAAKAASSAASNQDGPYIRVERFAKAKPVLTAPDPATRKPVQYRLLGTEEVNGEKMYILGVLGNESQQIGATLDTKFSYALSDEKNQKVRELLIDKKTSEAIQELRYDFYALLPLIEESEEMFPIQEPLLEYLELLLADGRVREFYAIFEKLNFKNIREEYTLLALDLAELYAQKKDFTSALKILDKLKIEQNNQDQIPRLMEILTIFRDANRIDDISRYYDRLYSIKGNSLATEAELWRIYCQIKKDNVETATILMRNMNKIDKKSEEYSLYKMIFGLIAKHRETNIPALEDFSEAIVYGQSVDQWMPELMYNTALSYKKADKLDVAKQILEEMRKFYPNNVYLHSAEKEIK